MFMQQSREIDASAFRLQHDQLGRDLRHSGGARAISARRLGSGRTLRSFARSARHPGQHLRRHLGSLSRRDALRRDRIARYQRTAQGPEKPDRFRRRNWGKRATVWSVVVGFDAARRLTAEYAELAAFCEELAVYGRSWG